MCIRDRCGHAADDGGTQLDMTSEDVTEYCQSQSDGLVDSNITVEPTEANVSLDDAGGQPKVCPLVLNSYAHFVIIIRFLY